MVCLPCLAPLAASSGLAGGIALSPKTNIFFLWLSIILSIIIIVWAALKLKRIYTK